MNIHGRKMNKLQGFGIEERGYIPVTEFAAQWNRSIHRKGREERKAEELKTLGNLRFLRLREFHGIPTAQGNKETVFFLTGLTGSTGWVILYDPVHPVILSRIKKPQMNADL
jgi:hypothetical protein